MLECYFTAVYKNVQLFTFQNDTLSSFKSVPSSFQSFNEDEDSDSMLSATSELGVYMQ